MRTQHYAFDEWNKTACGKLFRELNGHVEVAVNEIQDVNCEQCQKAIALGRPRVCGREENVDQAIKRIFRK